MHFKKLGLVFSGGGGKGAYQIGVWKALREFELENQIAAVAGTSVGALNGAMLVQDKYDQAEHMWLNIESRNMLSMNSTPQLLDMITYLTSVGVVPPPVLGLLQTRGIYSQEGLISMIREGLHAAQLVASNRSLTVALHDMKQNRVVYQQITNEQTADRMLLATAALPIIFNPVSIDGTFYCDGGFYWGVPNKNLDNTPVKPLVEAGCDTIIVVCLSQNDLAVTARQYPGVRLLPIVSTTGYGSTTAPLDFSNEGARWRMDQGYSDAVKIFQHLQLFIDNENRYEELWARTLAGAEQEKPIQVALQNHDKSHTESVRQVQAFDRVIARDDFKSEITLAEDDNEAPLALQILVLENTNLLDDLDREQIEADVNRFVVENANNRDAVENAAMDALAALSPVTGRANGLHDQGLLSRLWSTLTGNSQRVFAENDRALAQAQFAALRLIAAVQEKGSITLEFTCALQNRINGAYREVARLSDRHNQDLKRVYSSMAKVYVKLRDQILEHDSRIQNLERRQALNDWLDHPDAPHIGNKSLRELAPHLRLACIINDFYRMTEGAWNAKELRTLWQMCINVGLTKEAPICASAFCVELVQSRECAQALLSDLVQVGDRQIPLSLPAAHWIKDLRQQQLVLNNPLPVIQSAWGYSEDQTIEAWSLALDVLYHMRAAGLAVDASGTLERQKTHWLDQLSTLDTLIEEGILPKTFGAQVRTLRQQISQFKLSIPLIGKFSSGKSTLLNTWLDDKIQQEDLDPCTTVATEFHYTKDAEKCVIVRSTDAPGGFDKREEIPLSEYGKRLSRLDPVKEGVIYIELHLHRPALAQHPDLVIVDTPGISSTVGHHEAALERYIGESVAYILCVFARSFFGEEERKFMLRQRQLGQSTSVLVCQEDLISTPSERPNIRATIATQAGVSPDSVRGCSANPAAPDLSGFIDLLANFENKKDQLFQQRFSQPVKLMVQQAEQLIRRQLNSDTNAGELKIKKSQVEKQREQLKESFTYEKEKLLSDCNGRLAEQISSAIASYLRNRRSEYVSQLRAGQDVGPLLTADAKNAFQLACSQTLQPILKQVAQKLSTSASLCQADLTIVESSLYQEEKNDLGGAIAAGAAGVAGYVLVGPVGAAIAAVATFMFSKNNAEAEANEEVLQAIENCVEQIRSVVPGAINKIAIEFLDRLEQQINDRLKVDAEILEKIEGNLQQDTKKREEIKVKAQQALAKVMALTSNDSKQLTA